jgi:hypothetical protein
MLRCRDSDQKWGDTAFTEASHWGEGREKYHRGGVVIVNEFLIVGPVACFAKGSVTGRRVPAASGESEARAANKC